MIYAEWGLQGLRSLAGNVKVIVIVDVLSFSTAVDVAVGRGAEVVPFPYGDEAAAEAAACTEGAVVARRRSKIPGELSLSPQSLQALARGARVVLPSANGSFLSHTAAGLVPHVLCGCLRNAGTVANAARALADGGQIGVIAAGERWPDDTLRPAIEDMLGAGAIIDHLGLAAMSAEALTMRDAFRAALPDIAERIRASLSGQELIARDYSGDVDMAVALNASAAAPVLINGRYRTSVASPA